MPSRDQRLLARQKKAQTVAEPRLQSLIALARLASITRSEQASLDSIYRWYTGLAPDLQNFFKAAIPQRSRFFEEFLAENCLNLPDITKIADFLAEQLLQEEGAQIAKERGAVFTPTWLARRVTRSALQHWRRLHRGGSLPQTIADLSCGTGVFLFELHSEFPSAHRIIGADIHPVACAYSRALSYALGTAWEIFCQDTLLLQPPNPDLFTSTNKNRKFLSFDLLIGNPPYVRSQLLPSSYSADLRTMYPSTRYGNFDLSVAFIENAIEILGNGGIASYILTHKFMTSEYGRHICNRLSRDVRVLSIEDFQDHQVFSGYTTYTCVLTFAKACPVKRFLFTSFPGGLIGKDDPGMGQTTSLPSDRLRSHPWGFATDQAHESIRLLRDDRHPLIDTVFGSIFQGLRTGANQVFVVNQEIAKRLEMELLVPFVNGEHIRRARIAHSDLYLVYPYRRNAFGNVVHLSQTELRQDFPKTWAYLCEHRSILEERSLDNNSPWYVYSRSQNLEIGSLRKLLVREMMPRAEFAADFEGHATFASGYALDASRLSDDDLRLWTAVLCTPTLEFALRQNGTQLRSGWFRLLKHHLRRVRLPAFSRDVHQEAVRIANNFYHDPGDALLLANLDDIVANAFSLSASHRDAIASILKDAHLHSIISPNDTKPEDSSILRTPLPLLSRFEPVRLEQYNALHRDRPEFRNAVTFVPNKTEPIHRWYKYTQGFSADLVISLLKELKVSMEDPVLDPFVGCGTTCLTCRQRGIPSIGLEVSPLMAWIAQIKVRNWKASELHRLLKKFSPPPPSKCRNHNYQKSIFFDYLTKAFASKILCQLWSISSYIDSMDVCHSHKAFLRIGLLSIMEDVSQIRKHGSHYRFMLKSENIGLQKLNTPIISPNADIRHIILSRLKEMIEDVEAIRMPLPLSRCEIRIEDARSCGLASESVSAVISSPPYLNRNNYIVQQKAELALMSMVNSPSEYRNLVHRTIRSHVEGRFNQGKAISEFPEIQAIVEALCLTENNNLKIPYMIAAYFDDLAEVFRELWRVMRPGSIGAFVVGNSRWGGVVVPVDHLLLKIAQNTGFQPERILITRLKGNSPQQMRQYGRIPVRESIIIFSKR